MSKQLPTMSKVEYSARMLVIFFAFITPFVFLLSQGYLPSISSYWSTPLQPLFIIANATTSYYFFASHSSWRIPATLLLFLTAFSVDSYPMVHNVLAVIFFISCLIPLYTTKHYKNFFWVYVISVFFMPFSITIGETLSISSLCVYHALILNKIYRVQKK